MLTRDEIIGDIDIDIDIDISVVGEAASYGVKVPGLLYKHAYPTATE